MSSTGSMFAGIPKEHHSLRLDDKVEITEPFNKFIGRIGTIENIILGDRFQIAIRMDGPGGEMAYLYNDTHLIKIEETDT